MLQIDQNIVVNTNKLGKSIRTLGIIGLIVPFVRFFFRITVVAYTSMYYSEEDLYTYIQGFIVQYRAYYISDLLFFATLAVFVSFFISHLFRFSSLSIPNPRCFKSSAILFLIALIGNGVLSICYGIYIESTYRQFLDVMLFGGDIDSLLLSAMVVEILIIGLYCIPSLLYLIGYSLFKKNDAIFHQILPTYQSPYRIPYTTVIVGAVIAFIADLLEIPAYFDENLTFIAMLISFVAYLTLNIGLIIVGSRMIHLIPPLQGVFPYPSSMPQPLLQPQFPPQPQPLPYLSYTFPSNPSSPSANPSSTIMPPSNTIPPRPPTLFCSRCGKTIPADSMFCMHCGNLIPKIR